jgi:proteasome activator subunit 3 (PA28 gamma)
MAHLHARKVLQYKERFKKEAEELLLTGFPSTILKLNTLIVNPKFKKRDFSDMHENFTPQLEPESVLDKGMRPCPPRRNPDTTTPLHRPRHLPLCSKLTSV